MKLLRFTGQQPTSFMTLPYLGEVEPGEFEARDADAESLLQRADVEDPAVDPASNSELPAEPEAPVPPKPRKGSASKTPEASEPAATDPSTSA